MTSELFDDARGTVAAGIPLSVKQSLELLRAVELYMDVAEQSQAQWGDDYLWEKWGLTPQMVEARSQLEKALRGFKE